MKEKIASEFNRTVRELLEKEGMTQLMLMEFAGVSSSTFSRWMTGKILPSLHDACKIARVLRVTIDDLIPPEVYKQ